MPHPVNLFINPGAGSNEYNAVAKALKAKPRVRLIGVLDDQFYYLVTSTRDLDQKYVLRLWEDEDKEVTEPVELHLNEQGDIEEVHLGVHIAERGGFWIECWCEAGLPPIDVKTRLPEHVPIACYHEAAVLIFGEQPEGVIMSDQAPPPVKKQAPKRAHEMRYTGSFYRIFTLIPEEERPGYFTVRTGYNLDRGMPMEKYLEQYGLHVDLLGALKGEKWYTGLERKAALSLLTTWQARAQTKGYDQMVRWNEF